MRRQIAFLLLAGSTQVLAAAPAGEVWHAYLNQLARQCPSKHLEWLAPADIRDALDEYKSHLSHGLQKAMAAAENHRCQDISAGATCDNVGDLDVANIHGLLPSVTASFCERFARCSKQSDCD